MEKVILFVHWLIVLLIGAGMGFNQNTGEFIAKENGLYDISATFLMKSGANSSLIVKLMHQSNISPITITQTLLTAGKNMKIGTSNSLFR